MLVKNNRKCINCGKVYTYCEGCAEFAHMPNWMAGFHDENCKNIFMTCADFNGGIMDKNTAKTILSTCDLSNKANFHSSVQKNLEIIFGVDEEVKEEPVEEKVEEPKEERIEPKKVKSISRRK